MTFWYTYILKSKKDGKLYIGSTSDLKRRFREHVTGKVFATKSRLPMEIIFYEAFLSKKDATRRELYLKTSKGKSTLKMMLKEYLDGL